MTTDRDALGRSPLSQPQLARPQVLLYLFLAVVGVIGTVATGYFFWRELLGVVLPAFVFCFCLLLAFAAVEKRLR